MRRWLLPLAALLALAFAAAVARAAAPIVLHDDRGQRVELVRPAERIVSLLPSLTEVLCDLQACHRLVGVDRHSNHPAAVQALPRLGGLDDPQVERIVALRPDLVIAAGSTRALQRLQSLGLRVLQLEPRRLADLQRAMQQLALAVGTPQAADEAWSRLLARLDDAATRVPPTLRGRSVYFEVASTPYAAGAASFIGEVLARMQLHNIVPAAQGPFPQLNPEFVLRAQPGLVIAARQALAEMPQRPGWRGLQALAAGRHCAFDAATHDAWMRPGPRLGDAALALADCLQRLAPPPLARAP